MSRTRRILDDNRVFSRAPMTEQSADQHREALAHHVDRPLRELLLYCENEAVDPHILSGGLAYNDVAAQLRKILDGE